MPPATDATLPRLTTSACKRARPAGARRGRVVLRSAAALALVGALLMVALLAGAAQGPIAPARAAEPAKPSGGDAAVKPPAATAPKPLPQALKNPLPESKSETPVAPAAERAPAPPQPAAVSPPGPAQSITFADWVLSCQPAAAKQRCALIQIVRDTKNRRIIQIMAKRNGPAAYLELTVPLGISIPYGVSLDLSDTVKLPTHLADCDPAGCRSVLALDEKTLTQIKSAKTLSVTFQDSKSGKTITISASPTGFEQGIAMVLAAS